MNQWISHSQRETEELACRLAGNLRAGMVVALFGGLGSGKTAFVRGLARGMGMDAEVSSPTFTLVHEYTGTPALVHFDMYRIETWEDLYSTGYFDYLESGAVLAVEWSENIDAALPDDAVRVCFEKTGETQRLIRIEGAAPDMVNPEKTPNVPQKE